MKGRTIKIEESGDFFRHAIKPKIRLSGRWLEQAGFKAGHRVQVEFIEAGVINLRFLGHSAQPTDNQAG